MPTSSEVALYRLAQAKVADRVARDLSRYWSTLDLSRPDAARDSLLRYMPHLTTTYGEVAAVLAADWYDEVRAEAEIPGLYAATIADPFPARYVEDRTRFGVRHLWTDHPERTLEFLLGAANEYALQPGRDTIASSSLADPKGTGWHRETRGDACKFCRMLAGRGGVYREASASFAAHGHCNCVAVPSWDADAPEVAVSAYVASERTSRMTPEQRERHTARVRAYLSDMDD
jgi:hypothetical protein